MPYVANQKLRWGDDWILPGEEVPFGEKERNYSSLLRRGIIREVVKSPPDQVTIEKDNVYIPLDWRHMNWNQLRTLALHFTNDRVTNKQKAIEIIEAEENFRGCSS